MPLPSIVRERCRAFLAAGEEIRYLFPATSVMSGLQPDSGYLVVVTGERVVVLGCGRRRRTEPRAVWAQYPRSMRLGPVEGHPALGPTVEIGNLTLAVPQEYVAVIRAADLEIAGAPASPEDPLPGL